MKNRRDKPLRRVSMENCNDYHCFDSTHLGKSFRTWERHFSIALLWPHPESHPNARRVIHPRCVRCRQRSNLQGQPRFITRPLLGLAPSAHGGRPVPKQFSFSQSPPEFHEQPVKGRIEVRTETGSPLKRIRLSVCLHSSNHLALR